ncbi:MAG: GGDEF domain-containing protein [Nitrospinota bacterium]
MPPTEPATILVVEANPAIRSDIERLLQHEGYGVTTVDAGQEALELLQEHEPFHLLLTSVALPDLDGHALLEASLAHAPSAPVILLTDASSVDRALDGLAQGAYDHLIVPCPPAELRATVRRGLERRRLEMELALRADTDPLTGLANRAVFERRLKEDFYKAHRYGIALSLLFIDIDEFKSVNDEHGHRVGDRYLKALSELISRNVRYADLVARYGGEEIVVLLPHTTASAGSRLAERLRELVGEFVFNHGDIPIQRTVSIGIASYPEMPVKDSEDLILAADMALYAAKRAGRNRVAIGRTDPDRDTA